MVFDFFFFFIHSLFLLFYKNYYHFTKGREPARSPKPDSFEFDLFTVDISSRVTLARLYRSRLDAAVQSSVALLGVIRCIRVWRLFTVDISSCMTPARFSRARLDAAVQSSVALLGAIRCSLGTA